MALNFNEIIGGFLTVHFEDSDSNLEVYERLKEAIAVRLENAQLFLRMLGLSDGS